MLFACSDVVLSAGLLRRRQRESSENGRYISQIRTALQVIERIRAGEAAQSCSDPGFWAALEEEGYDGQYAQTLLYVGRLQ